MFPNEGEIRYFFLISHLKQISENFLLLNAQPLILGGLQRVPGALLGKAVELRHLPVEGSLVKFGEFGSGFESDFGKFVQGSVV